MAGDMNEVGQAPTWGSSTPGHYFIDLLNPTKQGALSQDVGTCCNNSNWIYKFDKVYATNSTIQNTDVTDKRDYGIYEQHYPIYVLVQPN